MGDLGYAVTAHRAQGVTCDTAHVLVEPTSTRENFYVAMTRGAQSNRAYMILDRADDDHAEPHPSDSPDASSRSVLYGVVQHSGAELSAHETITAEQDRWGSIAQLAAEYETVAAAAQKDRWAALIHASGLDEEQAESVVGSEAFGALTAELRRAEANHHDIDRLFPRLVAARGFDDAEDIAKVMHYRLARAAARPAGSGRTRKTPALIAGLVPQARGTTTTEMREALTERQDLIEARADAVLDAAVADGEPWTASLGTVPKDGQASARWRRYARVVAAYRDRYQVTESSPLGPAPGSDVQKVDYSRANGALRRIAPQTKQAEPRQATVRRGVPDLGL